MSRDDAGTTAKFLRGLTIGALVGAVLAGSSLWSRRQRGFAGRGGPRPITPPTDPSPGLPAAVPVDAITERPDRERPTAS